MPAISVILPIYNVEKFLRRCFDSVLNQTFSDWEAICVNDGSPDNSQKIIDEYVARDSRFKCIKKENGGLSDARNVGLAAATGEYVLYVDSDDFIHPQTMEITYALARRDNSDIVSFRKDLGLRSRLVVKQFLGGDVDVVNPPGLKKRYTVDKILTKTSDDIFLNVTERSHRLKYLQIKHAYVWQNLYRRELISGLKFIKGIIMEDFPWWSEIWLLHPRVTITRLPFYYYIPQLGSIMASTKQLRILDNIVTGIKHAYAIYQERATQREMDIWQKEFLWPFLAWAFRKVRALDNQADIKNAQMLFKELKDLGILDNPVMCRAHWCRRKILKFIKNGKK